MNKEYSDFGEAVYRLSFLFRDVKRRSNFRTSNYMYELELGIVTFDIWFQLARSSPVK